MIRLDHANITVDDPDATADWLCNVFGWQVLWRGSGIEVGRTVHVGTDDSYIALFTFGGPNAPRPARYRTQGMLNQLSVLTEEDIGAVEARVANAGFEPINHREAGARRRFCFLDHDGIEWEVAARQG
ncbi:VOC family protein [Pseudooceanicola marinus]|uniref:VOC family protein n=1 Tax=Pseudooceanicola marinus TaxID=396013 RepID=UPI001C98BB88|nr:VOC family protein [Pseudooceanicola marinus]MBY5973479.1 VOC family protein [Ferrimonas balearica]MCA1336276.1 VOC family protein [Pseudooceanicola marinus]